MYFHTESSPMTRKKKIGPPSVKPRGLWFGLLLTWYPLHEQQLRARGNKLSQGPIGEQSRDNMKGKVQETSNQTTRHRNVNPEACESSLTCAWREQWIVVEVVDQHTNIRTCEREPCTQALRSDTCSLKSSSRHLYQLSATNRHHEGQRTKRVGS